MVRCFNKILFYTHLAFGNSKYFGLMIKVYLVTEMHIKLLLILKYCAKMIFIRVLTLRHTYSIAVLYNSSTHINDN
jgi:hypothetical protein